MPAGDPSPTDPAVLPPPAGPGRPTPAGGVLPLHLNGPTPPPPTPAPATTPAPDAAAPADLVPAPTRRERLGWYAGTVALTCALVFAGLRLDAVDITVPLSYDGDVLLIMPMVKATLERGSHWRNERMGYPGVMELHDFPVIDHLHFAVIWLIGKVVPDYALVFNLYYLLTYPLTALTAMWALRLLRLTLPMAAAGGILYAFAPYHYLRGESHYFLSAYWVVPLSLLPALAALRGEFPFLRRDPDGTYRPALRRWDTLWQVVLAAATASAGAYYAFYACLVYAFVGVYGWAVYRTWRAAASLAAVAALVTAFGVANHAPAIVYAAEHGRNPVTERNPTEADLYGLKLAHLVLPVDWHNVTALGWLKARYNSYDRPLQTENTAASLGAVAAAGLVGLLVCLILPGRRGWPYGPVAALVLFVLLYATIGGFASLFNFFVFDQIRCPNRISIYLAFLCLFVALWWFDRFLLTRTGRARRFRLPAVAGLVVFGMIDQTPTAWFAGHMIRYTAPDAERFRADRRFFARIEEVMPPGATVFTLPYIPYPEVPGLGEMNTYEHARGYLHTTTLVWGYGVMKNRYLDVWQESVAHDAHDQLLRRVVVRGFDGLLVDTRGFAVLDKLNQGEALVADVKRLAGRVHLPEVRHEDGQQVFLDLRPYRDWLREQDPGRFEEWARAEREWPAIEWASGFYTTEPYGHRNHFRWAYPASRAVLVNPSDRTRRFILGVTFGVDAPGDFTIRVGGETLTWHNAPGGPEAPWADEFVVRRKEADREARRTDAVPGERKSYVLDVPPGRHPIRFRCTVPQSFHPTDHRPLCYYLAEVQLIEVK